MSKASSEFMRECDGAPRLNEMFQFFSATAAGRSGAPENLPTADFRLLQHDTRLLEFAERHRALWGQFDPHFFSSIPYVLEEEIRHGDALLEYAKSKQRSHSPVGYYVLGGAEGTLARTLGSMAGGAILTLSCSPNKENEASFLRHGQPRFSSFFHGPFHRLTSEFLLSDAVLKPLGGKFDVILEDTTFQMYSPNRSGQISFVKQYLKDDGVFLFVEKFRHEGSAEYVRRELQKDYGYKARYFSADEIAQKNKIILERMNLNEVTIETMAAALREHFVHACMTWNSGNFYAIAASNNAQNLFDFVGRMCEPCIPHEYNYEKLPRPLPGFSFDLPPFRHVKRAP
ncbi:MULTISPECIES: class I SAM-dependent methyltransferase [unclassified Shinella]|uniref:class I SAM-dependent methyltransferase n=1 Tax=unclassified Shinella TaxID=2643062 RepID=UPI00225C5161|nr:class I SAM-dependent methyltransferase [Shinella sp. YE25]MDC7259552.1 class I SAM-dependent methyltransferase [Shinella sp. YE25]CAI0341330.1 conserved hypothetical protein [Rhizobiaceae bacterium]CAK7260967.1 Class I SAM-dependent methyltransferase [Shinella sp. WSC3-e]